MPKNFTNFLKYLFCDGQIDGLNINTSLVLDQRDITHQNNTAVCSKYAIETNLQIHNMST